jgi:hypothetical protein
MKKGNFNLLVFLNTECGKTIKKKGGFVHADCAKIFV